MRILFDVGIPRLLGPRLFNQEVEEVRERGWATLPNGELLDRAGEAGFDVLITTDQSLRHQQSLSNRRMAVVVLMSADWNRISRQTELIRSALEFLQPGEVRGVPIPVRDEHQRDHRHQ